METLKLKNKQSTLKEVGRMISKEMPNHSILIISATEDVPKIIHYTSATFAGISNTDLKYFEKNTGAENDETVSRVLSKIIGAEKEILEKYNMKTLFIYGESDFNAETEKRIYDSLFSEIEKDFDYLFIDYKVYRLIENSIKNIKTSIVCYEFTK